MVRITGSESLSGGTTISSPDGRVRFEVIPHGARLDYAVTFRGKPVIKTSPMGITVDGVSLTEGVDIGRVEPYRVEETYPWRGVHARAVSHHNGTRISLKHGGSNTAYELDVRAANDGVAFRFVIPGEGQRVPDESTTFTFPAGSTVWYHGLRGHYEGEYEKKDIADVPADAWAAPPLTAKLPGGSGYASITEAALMNYSGMALQADGRRGFGARLGHRHPVSYPFELRYGAEEAKRLARPAAVTGTISTPWRLVMIGADLGALVNSDMVPNLCPPPDPALFPEGLATEWVRPGRAVWQYLDGRERTLDEMKEFCRLAGELGFEHNVIEGFWRNWTDAEIRGLVEYGRQQNVGIWLWKHSKELHDPEARRPFFERCRDLGIAGVKIDFFDHEAKEVIDLYQAILKETAEYRLMVNFHGSNKPTGEARTWPNELTREAVRGMEASKLQERARHDVILPFTRLLTGHADYTPVHFGERRADTSWAHQVASAAILLSPLLTYAANPRNILANPCAPMIKSIPAVWEETIVLPVSEIGEIAAFARRRGDTWFLAVMNGPSARTIQVPLSFLGEGEYRALLVRDRKDDPAAVQLEEATLDRAGWLTVDLRDGGGFITRFSR